MYPVKNPFPAVQVSIHRTAFEFDAFLCLAMLHCEPLQHRLDEIKVLGLHANYDNQCLVRKVTTAGHVFLKKNGVHFYSHVLKSRKTLVSRAKPCCLPRKEVCIVALIEPENRVGKGKGKRRLLIL